MFGEGTLEILPDGFGFPPQSRLPLPALPRRHLRVAQPDSPVRTEEGSHRRRPDPAPKENERYFALLPGRGHQQRGSQPGTGKVSFDDLTPLHPQQRLNLITTRRIWAPRVVDMMSPIGMGQRALIVSPPRAGKTNLLQKFGPPGPRKSPPGLRDRAADRRRARGSHRHGAAGQGGRLEVISSTFDEPSSRHVQVSEMVIEKAKRMVEHGHDVVIFLDSITRWPGLEQRGSALGQGALRRIDLGALQHPKGVFRSGPQCRGRWQPDGDRHRPGRHRQPMDDVIFEEFKGTGNTELHLDRRSWKNASGRPSMSTSPAPAARNF
ncbi:MAG: hypothetical protein Ct9H300mP1_04380 [Planctomycetaceae bacterium]|nr:MAG: hypothetical protein Ct9H300mP1_04380 [Planctomycetaceae bacterium]